MVGLARRTHRAKPRRDPGRTGRGASLSARLQDESGPENRGRDFVLLRAGKSANRRIFPPPFGSLCMQFEGREHHSSGNRYSAKGASRNLSPDARIQRMRIRTTIGSFIPTQSI